MSKELESQNSLASESLRTLSFGTLWRVLRYPFVLITIAVVPRLMGVEADYGKYALFISIMVIWDTVARIGTTQIFGRFIPEIGEDDIDGRAHLLHTVLLYGVLLTVVVCAFGWLFIMRWGLEGFDASWMPAMAAVLLLSKIEGTFFGFLYGLNQIGRFSSKETLRSALTLGFVVLFYHMYGLTGALWGLAANEAVFVVLGAWWTRQYLFRRWRIIGLRDFAPYLVFGIAFYIPSFLFGLLQRSGNVFVSELTCSYEQVSIYDLANQFLLLLGMFFRQFMAALVPSLTLLHVKGDQAAIQRWQRTAMTFCAVLASLAFNALMLFGKPVLVLWLDSETAGASVHASAVIVAFALIPLLISQVGLNLAILEKRPKIYAWSVLCGLVTLGVLSTRLIPLMGARGAAWATLSGYSAAALVFCLFYRGRILGTLARFAAALAVGCIFIPIYRLELAPAHAVCAFMASSAVYVGLLFVLRIIRISEIESVLVSMRKPSESDS